MTILYGKTWPDGPAYVLEKDDGQNAMGFVRGGSFANCEEDIDAAYRMGAAKVELGGGWQIRRIQ